MFVVSLHECACVTCVCQLKIINKGPLIGGEDLLSINSLKEIIPKAGKHGHMVCFMRQKKEGIVRERGWGGQALFMESIASNTD